MEGSYKEGYAQKVLARAAVAQKFRETHWDTEWQDISDYMLPRKSNISTTEPYGDVRTEHIWDSSPEDANNILAAGQLSYVCPANEYWFKYSPNAFNKANDEVTRYMDYASEVGFNMIANSNFYMEIHETFLQRSAFGTCCLYMGEDPERGIYFQDVPVGSFSIEEDANGMVDTVYRHINMTPRQMAQKFGEDNIHPEVKKLLYSDNANDHTKPLEVIHYVAPNENWNTVAESEFPIKSCYVDKQYQHILEEGGFYEMPYFVSRYLKSNTEIYGRSPGIQKIPEIRQLNLIVKDITLAIEKMVNPPILMPEESAHLIDNRPAGITLYDPRDPNNIPKEWQTNAKIGEAYQMADQLRKSIETAFHVDMFMMFKDAPPHLTATQVMEMSSEKLVLFSPTFARLTQEILKPLLKRLFNIMYRNNILQDEPPSLEKLGNYDITFVSRISLAIKALQNRSFMQAMEILIPIREANPEIMDNINLDKATRNVLSNYGLPVDWTNSERQVELTRVERQKQMEAQMQMQQAEQMAGAYQKAASGEASLKQAR